MSNHTTLTVHHGPQSVPLADGHETSGLRRWNQYALEGRRRYPESQVALTLRCPPVQDEVVHIVEVQPAVWSNQLAKQLQEKIEQDIYQLAIEGMNDADVPKGKTMFEID